MAYTLLYPHLSLNESIITAEAASVKINKTKLYLHVGGSYKLKFSETKEKIKWESSKKTIATVSKNGNVKGFKAGKATIIATVDDKTYKCSVTVSSDFEVKDGVLDMQT